MSRHRDLAASPARTASECWNAVAELIAATLARSPSIDEAGIATTLASLTPAGRALVAGGHLDREPVTLVAEPLRLTVGTVSGERALIAIEEEKPGPVPGAATATGWTLYLPAPPGLAPLVEEVASGVPHVIVGAPPAAPIQATKTTSTIDLTRLDPRVRRSQ